ncbi:MAG: hypothetical protein ABIE94_02280 [archaeon]
MVKIEEIGKKFGWKEEVAEDVFVEADRYPKYSGYYETGFVQPMKRYRLILENFSQPMEDVYWWILTNMRTDHPYNRFEKTLDVFSAAENSAFFGQSSQRLGIQQDKASSFLAIIGKMVKEVFQLVREVRILNERLSHYEDSFKGSEAAEITLKGYWVDLVEGGAKNPASVYGIATQVGFATLPDLFFSTTVLKALDVDQKVDSLDFNRKLREVLKRKLRAYMTWKEETFKELKQRKRFTLKYLRQHWNIIRMYMSWVKPYLRNIKRLSMREEHTESVDMVSAFENSIIEVEFMAIMKSNKGYCPCALMHFKYVSRPTMHYRQEYQQGPVHLAKLDVCFRLYGWHEKEVETWKRFRKEEEIDLLELVDSSVKASMDALRDDLEAFLEEAGEPIEKKETLTAQAKRQSQRRGNIFDPFLSIGRGFGELAGSAVPQVKKKDKAEKPFKYSYDQAFSAAKAGFNPMWQVYKNFKKGHKMLSW